MVDRLFMTQDEFDDIVEFSVEATYMDKGGVPRQVTLDEMEEEVKTLAPFLFNMKLRIGPVRKMLGKLYKRMQTIRNSAAMANKNLSDTRKRTEAALKENVLLRNLVRGIGMQLPDDLTGTSTIQVTQEQVVLLAGVAKDLILWHGEKQLEQSEHAMFNEVSPHFLPAVDFSMGSRVPYNTLGNAIKAHKAGLMSVEQVAKVVGLELDPNPMPLPTGSVLLKTLRDDIISECNRQGYMPCDLKLYMSKDKQTLHIDTTGISTLGAEPTIVFNRQPLKSLFASKVPAGVYIETSLL